MRRFFLAAILAFTCSWVSAIDLVVPTAPIKVGAVATLQMRGLGPADQEKAIIEVSPKDSATIIPAAWGGKSFLIFQATTAGSYEIKISLNPWVLALKDAVEVSMASGAQSPLLGELVVLHQKIATEFPSSVVKATVVVGEPGPNPPPGPPPPTPSGRRQIVIVRESAEATPSQSRVIVALRDGPTAKSLRDRGHKLFVVDKDQSPEWMSIVTGIALPALVITDESGKQVLSKGQMPLSVPEIEQTVKSTGG